MLKKIWKGIAKHMDEKVRACKEILSSARNRLTLGLIILGAGFGVGGGLIASAYIRVID